MNDEIDNLLATLETIYITLMICVPTIAIAGYFIFEAVFNG